jgi:hypothetical protein
METPQTRQILRIVESAFSRLGATEPIIESAVIIHRYYIGRKFNAGGSVAMWMAQKNTIMVFDQSGYLVQTINLNEQLEKAA